MEGSVSCDYTCRSGGGEAVRTLVESLKIIKLRSEAALAGGVDDEDNLALQAGKI